MGGSSGSGKTTTENKIPAELSELTRSTAERVGGVQGQPGFSPAEYIAPNVQKIPGLAYNQQAAIEGARRVGTPTYGRQAAYSNLANAVGYAGQSGRATGGTLATDPSMAAAYQAYKQNVEPDIQSQYGLMGLGKSSLMGDALARGAASQLYPATEAALAREQSANEARIGRQTSAALQAAGQYGGLGESEVNQRLAQLNALMATGGAERGVESERGAAEQQDALRRQALAEQATFGVLGQVPSSLGSQVASKTSSGGMFKILPWVILIGGFCAT